MKFPSLSLQDLAFIGLVSKIIISGGSIPEAVVAVALLGTKGYQMWLDKKTTLQKTEDMERKISNLEGKLFATGLVKRSASNNV
jgi:hypothetical protein